MCLGSEFHSDGAAAANALSSSVFLVTYITATTLVACEVQNCFKILMLTHKALNNQAPDYISELLTLYKPSRALKSSKCSKCSISALFYPAAWSAGRKGA